MTDTLTTPLVFAQDAATTYVSVLRTDPNHPKVKSASHNVQYLHQLVMTSVRAHLPDWYDPFGTTAPSPELEAPGEQRKQFAVLFAAKRNSPEDHAGKLAGVVTGLYVTSLAKPFWDELVGEGICVVQHLGVETHAYRAGDRLSVQMWANPTMDLKEPGDGRHKRGSRVSLGNPNDAADWLRRTMARHGATVDDAKLRLGQTRGLRAPSKSKQLKVVLRPYTFVVTVDDPDKFAHAAVNGVGRSKAFGAGLMRIQRLAAQ